MSAVASAAMCSKVKSERLYHVLAGRTIDRSISHCKCFARRRKGRPSVPSGGKQNSRVRDSPSPTGKICMSLESLPLGLGGDGFPTRPARCASVGSSMKLAAIALVWLPKRWSTSASIFTAASESPPASKKSSSNPRSSRSRMRSQISWRLITMPLGLQLFRESRQASAQ